MLISIDWSAFYLFAIDWSAWFTSLLAAVPGFLFWLLRSLVTRHLNQKTDKAVGEHRKKTRRTKKDRSTDDGDRAVAKWKAKRYGHKHR